jgi:CubicO group peptidase (beta-lactamase class C family)
MVLALSRHCDNEIVYPMRLPVIFVALCASLLAACASAQTQSGIEGRYEYEGGATLLIAEHPDDGGVFAVINNARYRLVPDGPDVFRNSSDVEVHFVRAANGEVIGYRVREDPILDRNPLRRMLDSNARVPVASWRARPPAADVDYSYRPPEDLRDGIAVGAVQGEILIDGLTALTQALYDEELENIDSVLVYRDGALLFEEYFYEYDAATLHQQRSATKTLVALLVGVALERGFIPSLDTPILPYFAHYADLANIEDRKRAITIRHLLTMQSGFDCDDWNSDSPGNESVMAQTDDWARFILDLTMAHAPGERGSYCSGNVILAGRIVEQATGRPLRDFADEVLFAPLGITHYEWDFRPGRSNTENFVQAWLRPRDMLKIGIMMLDGGQWRGRQIISPAYIEDMTRAHSEIDGTPYGYFYWRRYINLPSGRFETPQATGNGGQKIIVLENESAVIVMTGGAYNQDSNSNETLARYVIPGLVEHR